MDRQLRPRNSEGKVRQPPPRSLPPSPSPTRITTPRPPRIQPRAPRTPTPALAQIRTVSPEPRLQPFEILAEPGTDRWEIKPNVGYRMVIVPNGKERSSSSKKPRSAKVILSLKRQRNLKLFRAKESLRKLKGKGRRVQRSPSVDAGRSASEQTDYPSSFTNDVDMEPDLAPQDCSLETALRFQSPVLGVAGPSRHANMLDDIPEEEETTDASLLSVYSPIASRSFPHMSQPLLNREEHVRRDSAAEVEDMLMVPSDGPSALVRRLSSTHITPVRIVQVQPKLPLYPENPALRRHGTLQRMD